MANSQRERALRYLLGKLPEQEAVEFEEQYFADDDLFEQTSALENDLIDSFVRGELSEAERQQFQKGYLVSPARRANLYFSTLLARRLSSMKPRNAEQRKIAPAFLAFQVWPRRLAWAAMAAVVIVGISWMLVVDRRLHHEIDSLRAQQAEFQHQEQSLHEEIAQLGPLEQESGIGQPKLPPPRVISLMLVPGETRGATPAGKLVIAPAAGWVQIDLYLEHDDYRSYRVSIENVEGQRIWEKNELKTHAEARGARAVSVKVSSSILRNGDYRVKLGGEATSGEFEEVEGYHFHAVRR